MSPQIMKDFRGWIRTALRCGALVALGFVFLALAAPRARAASPCCEITKIDLATGVATAKVIATGQSFQFKVSDVALLHSLKVGQGVFANFKTQKVSVDGGGPCCEIVNLDKVGSAGNTAAARNLGNAVNPVSPCCQITSIDEAAGVVTAKVNSTGQTFQFKVANAALLHSLKVGQGVFANFKTHQVSVDGVQPCCDVISTGATPIAAANGATVSSQGVSKPGLPVPTKANMRTIDPCMLASAAQLQQYAAANIAAAFPITYNHNGESVNIHEPQLSNLTCAPLHIEVSAAIHYRKTRGIPQGSASGHLRFGSPVVARIVSTAAPNAPIASANFQSAQLCLTDITVN